MRASWVHRVLSACVAALFLGALLMCGFQWGVSTLRAQAQPFKSGEKPSEDRKLIDIKADIVYPYKINPDSSVMCLVGNFAAQHNGALITADSAVRYSDQRLECFGNVLINKNTTYAYADRADYNGVSNIVTLYAPIVKVVDEGSTLYTYNFTFNTLDNIGRYWGGGIMLSKKNRMESHRGFYYADFDEIVGVGDVELRTETYDLTGDSVRYNMETEFAQYFENTNIWNEKDEYLYADRGTYDKPRELHSITLNGYILTKEQEVWSDTMDYYEAREVVIMRNNIQIDDTTNKTLAYGDAGKYWSAMERALLTKKPLVINYDLEQGDTLFMKADTIELVTRSHGADRRRFVADSLARVKHVADSLARVTFVADSILAERAKADSLRRVEKAKAMAEAAQEAKKAEVAETTETIGTTETTGTVETVEKATTPVSQPSQLSQPSQPSQKPEPKPEPTPEQPLDTLAQDTTAKVVLTPKELKAKEKEEALKAKAEAKRLKNEEITKKKEAVSLKRIEARKAKLEAQKAREARTAAKRKEKLIARAAKRGETLTFDDDDKKIDSLGKDSIKVDSLPKVDSTKIDSMKMDSLAIDSAQIDTTYRLVKGYRNVRSYRSDFQSISDSMVTDSRDTTIHLYINPVLWNGVNQITSDIVDVYTRNSEIHHAHFTGSPIMASQIDTLFFNQVKGKEMTAYMRNNEIYRNDVDGNVETIYFVQDDNTKEVTTLAVIESGTATFYIEQRQIEGITYRAEPNYIFYPLNKIPITQSLTLKGFEWHIDERPLRDEFSERTQRPTIREEKSALERPKFPIEEAMRLEMEALIRDNRWIDRDDIVIPAIEEWFNALGYKSGQPRPEDDKK